MLSSFSRFLFLWLLSSFTKIINPNYLLIGIEIFVVIFIVVIILIYTTLYYKKRIYFFSKKIQEELEVWVMQAILDDLEPGEHFNIPKSFFRTIKSRVAKQFVIDELIKTKKNLTDSASNNIIELYLQLDLKKVSLDKINHRKWYIRAKGIHELYFMQQMDTLSIIYENTNSKNEFVRMEAQNGMINMTGFDGLRFLDIVSYPITEWQQIKLLDQLKMREEDGYLAMHIPKWFLSKNDTVMIFALKLAGVYQQFAFHDPVVKCLTHKNPFVRIQTIKTLEIIANETTAHILTDHYHTEKLTNKLAILDVLTKIGTVQQAWFLIALLDDESDVVKLKAGRALAHSFPQGLEALEERGRAPYGPYKNIYLHVKAEMRK